jgi:hypothetical protein
MFHLSGTFWTVKVARLATAGGVGSQVWTVLAGSVKGVTLGNGNAIHEFLCISEKAD